MSRVSRKRTEELDMRVQIRKVVFRVRAPSTSFGYPDLSSTGSLLQEVADLSRDRSRTR
jgi:hypothetical protein